MTTRKPEKCHTQGLEFEMTRKQKALLILKDHQKWRKGWDETPATNPQCLSSALDIAIECLEMKIPSRENCEVCGSDGSVCETDLPSLRHCPNAQLSTPLREDALEALDWIQANTHPIVKGQYAIGGKHIKTIRQALEQSLDGGCDCRDILEKQIELHYQIMTHDGHSDIVKDASSNAYHALCTVKHKLPKPPNTKYEIEQREKPKSEE